MSGVILAACGPSAQDLAGTYVAQTFEALPPTATETATSTPRPTELPTATLSPSPTMFPSITPMQEAIAIVGAEVINLREGPGLEYEQIGGASPGEELEVIGRTGDCEWIKVSLVGVGTGWVSRYVIELRVACDQITQLIIPTPGLPVEEGATQPASNSAPGDHVIRVNNKTGSTVLLTLEGEQTYNFSFPPGNGQRISIKPGNYTVTYAACGETTSYNDILNVNSLFDFKCP
ncbi:MAG: SH3 domain-containing protein [Chloroflexi bacterium]|nr:SH3 domain-containing protein [Chloroflexota bacterium]